MQVIAYEPEPLEREFLSALLNHEGYSVQLLMADESVVSRVRKSPGAMVMVSMQDVRRGLNLCERVRQETQAPLLALTSRADEELDTQLYELGVDEVIARPVLRRVFVDRLENLRRRTTAPASQPEEGLDRLTIGPFQLIPSRLELRKNGQMIHLTPLQTRILYHLMANAGQIVPRTRLEDKVWGYDGEVLSNAVKTHICHLRQKVEDDPLSPRFIQTVKGVGYLFQKLVVTELARESRVRLPAGSPRRCSVGDPRRRRIGSRGSGRLRKEYFAHQFAVLRKPGPVFVLGRPLVTAGAVI